MAAITRTGDDSRLRCLPAGSGGLAAFDRAPPNLLANTTDPTTIGNAGVSHPSNTPASALAQIKFAPIRTRRATMNAANALHAACNRSTAMLPARYVAIGKTRRIAGASQIRRSL